MDDTMTVSSKNEVAVPADIHAIQHLPVALIADALYPTIWIQIQQLRITSAFNVKALHMQACITCTDRAVILTISAKTKLLFPRKTWFVSACFQV